ncbi:MAG: hypothetical protein JWN74_3586 [Acidobacteriaceae bacterium]|nr:hypothetical protein [Acidobacteriaceae bacterium]
MVHRLAGSGLRRNRLILTSAAIILSLLSLSFKPAPRNYLESLVMLDGTDYWILNCSQYICAAKRHRHCLAKNFWEYGCDGDAFVVQDVPSFEDIDTSKLVPGDVAIFHGVHVAAFIGNRTWMDSDYRHGGVGIMRRNRRKGGWFYGEVKILRWKNQ